MTARGAVLSTLIFLFAAAHASAQPRMRQYNAVLSFGGWYRNTSSSENMLQSDGIEEMRLHNREMEVSFRAGLFPLRHLAVGAELSWTYGRTERTPEPNPYFARTRRIDDAVYAAPWIRWYLPATDRWWFFLDASGGYAYTARDEEISSSGGSVLQRSYLDGGGLRAGAGISFLIDRRVALEGTLRYSGTWYSGHTERPGMADSGADISEEGLELLVGFQVLL